jgi:hypothetical protein
MKLLQRLFAEDTEPGDAAWSHLQARLGGSASGALGDRRSGRVEAASRRPEVTLDGRGELQGIGPAPARSRRVRRVAVAGAAAVVLAAFAVVVHDAASARSSVQRALSSLFDEPTLQVSIATTTGGCYAPYPAPKCVASQYRTVLTVSSENGQPLAGNDGSEEFELSIFKGSDDVGDLVIADGAVYARLGVDQLSQADYSSALRSLEARVTGDALLVAQRFVTGGWVEMSDGSVKTAAGRQGSTTGSQLATLRRDAVMSFAQAWDTWSSLKTIPLRSGTVDYQLTMPARSFFASFANGIDNALRKDTPAMNGLLDIGPALVDDIKSGYDIPLSLTVIDGQLTGLDVTGTDGALLISMSHPADGVSPPSGAALMTSDDVSALEQDYFCRKPPLYGDPCGVVPLRVEFSGSSIPGLGQALDEGGGMQSGDCFLQLELQSPQGWAPGASSLSSFLGCEAKFPLPPATTVVSPPPGG